MDVFKLVQYAIYPNFTLLTLAQLAHLEDNTALFRGSCVESNLVIL